VPEDIFHSQLGKVGYGSKASEDPFNLPRQRAGDEEEEEQPANLSEKGKRKSPTTTITTTTDSVARCAEIASIAAAVSGPADAIPKAWAAVQSEFRVQAQIWESQALMSAKGGGKGEASESTALKAEIKNALKGSSSDPAKALKLLEKAAAKAGSLLNNSTRTSLSELQGTITGAAKRLELAELLRNWDEKQKVPADIEELIAQCKLDDKLEFRVRVVLGLGPKAALKSEVPLLKDAPPTRKRPPKIVTVDVTAGA